MKALKQLLWKYGAVVFLFATVVTCREDQHLKTGDAAYDFRNDFNFVTMEEAMKVAVNIEESKGVNMKGSRSGRIVKSTKGFAKKKITSSFAVKDKIIPTFYAFNYQGGGWSVISSDRRVRPILAYSAESTYKENESAKPEGLLLWEETNKKMFGALRNDFAGSTAISSTSNEWVSLEDECLPEPDPGDRNQDCIEYDTYLYSNIVGPLTSSQWGQACVEYTSSETYPFNASLDASSRADHCYHVLAGCVAIAMAQIIKYHHYGTLFNWSSMSGTSGAGDGKNLILFAAESVNMDYGDSESGASISDIPEGFEVFSYASDYYNSYNPYTVMSNLNSSRPVILAGCRSGGICHAWVCDGYQENVFGGYTTLYLKMNWGWYGEANSGWYAYDNWTIPGTSENYFTSSVKSVVNIHP